MFVADVEKGGSEIVSLIPFSDASTSVRIETTASVTSKAMMGNAVGPGIGLKSEKGDSVGTADVPELTLEVKTLVESRG